MIETMWNYRTGKMIENDETETKKRNKATRKEKDNKQKILQHENNSRYWNKHVIIRLQQMQLI